MIEEKKEDWRVKHWLSYSKIYMRYYHIKERCENIKNVRYKNYWWRWIKNMWNTFNDFLTDMHDSYSDWLSIDRIDTNWNYCKENCRWIKLTEQQRNKNNTRYIKVNWEIVPAITISEKEWISVHNVIKKYWRFSITWEPR